MTGATAEQLKPIKSAIRAIQFLTLDVPLMNSLHMALTHLEPGVQPDKIEWVCAVLTVEMGSADVRDYEGLVHPLENVISALRAIQSDPQPTGV